MTESNKRGEQPIGRPSELTVELRERVLAAYRGGAETDEAGIHAAGVSVRTWYNWKKVYKTYKDLDDLDGLTDYEYRCVELFKLIHVERIRVESEVEQVWRDAMVKHNSWRAAAEYLKAKNPAKWNPAKKLELAGKDGGPIQQEYKLNDFQKLLKEVHELWDNRESEADTYKA